MPITKVNQSKRTGRKLEADNDWQPGYEDLREDMRQKNMERSKLNKIQKGFVPGDGCFENVGILKRIMLAKEVRGEPIK